jgi:hypothetical protein
VPSQARDALVFFGIEMLFIEMLGIAWPVARDAVVLGWFGIDGPRLGGCLGFGGAFEGRGGSSNRGHIGERESGSMGDNQ